ncbi:MAG: hypothetical protein E6J14_02660 [Chloroflexi bacterium]|nr:MAG: hypothetical protein E6J14_02660 [Chloroflexota bacterium]
MPYRTVRHLAAAGCAAILGLAVAGASRGAAAGPSVLRVGSYHGIAGTYASVQVAVDAAQPGDWVLVGPGDYHESGANDTSVPKKVAGVLITTAGVHLRGMDRNGAIVDGTKPGAAGPCDPAAGLQQFGPNGSDGTPTGRNGVEVYKADGVSVENLTICNFQSSDGGNNGNQLWFNGGDSSGKIGMGPFAISYITASDSYYKDSAHGQGAYGIFTSNERGPGVIAHTYASNMGDSSYYVGACPDCNVDLTDAHAVNSALGFSGTNAGGHLLIENSEWNDNKVGILPNSLNNDDAPSPQDGACPNGGTGPTGTPSCTVIRNNYVHDNNNANTPQLGIAGAAPVGAGIEISGGHNDTVVDNRIINQGGWGIVINDFPDTGTPPPVANCNGGFNTPAACDFVAYGTEVAHNTLGNNGGFGNPGNGDLAVATAPSGANPGNCFHHNRDSSGTLSSDPPAIETLMGTCGQPNSGYSGPTTAGLFCATGGIIAIGPVTPQCALSNPPLNYPTPTHPTTAPIPHDLATMPDPCTGVPANPWCPTAAVAAATATAPTALANTAMTPVAPGVPAVAAVVGLVLTAAWRRRESRSG